MKFLKRFSPVILIVLAGIYIQQCAGDSVNAPQDFISGTVTFTDTLMNRYTGGNYFVMVYADSTNPFSHAPVANTQLVSITSGGVSTADYKISGLSGKYYVAVT